MKKIYIAITSVAVVGLVIFGVLLLRSSGINSTKPQAVTSGMSDSTNMSMSAKQLANLTGDAYDKMFINMMSEHHAGAVAMAQYAQKSTKPEVKQLADNIIAAQSKELADMKSWATAWGYNYVVPSQQAIGIMTASLVGKAGDDLDQQFLNEMIGHHESALDMAQYSRKNAKHQEIVDLSANIKTTQTAEIKLMKSIASTYGYSDNGHFQMDGMSGH